MTPSLGRIVIYTPVFGAARTQGVAQYAAIVGQVSVPGVPICTLYVLPPGQTPYWEQNVPEGTGPGTWMWPPRA